MKPPGPIRVLADSLVEKIAAGEVIERPASIVKELIENSLDAGASRIEVRLVDGGRKEIVVTDDGHGIPADQVLLALKSHATSKIGSAEDLFQIESYGFRGEALASIAAVSQLDLLTRAPGSESGVRVRSEGGAVRSQEPLGMSPGTTVVVSNLFFNTPARKKFMRSRGTELGHIETAVRRCALALPDREFLLENDGETVLHAPAAGSPRERLGRLYGNEALGQLTAFDAADGGLRAHGFVSNARLSFSRPDEIWLFVNGRPVKDRMLQAAVMAGFRTALMERRYPLAVVHVSLRPRDVDVNVHPAKAEVRFADPQPVFRLVSGAIASALRTAAPRMVSPQGPESFPPSPSPAGLHSMLELISETATARTEAMPYATAGKGPFSSLRFLGDLDRTYLLFLGSGSLVMIDQHAAHERVQFERLKTSVASGKSASQHLLVPLTLELTAGRLEALDSLREFLPQIGFKIEPFGERTVAIKAVPDVTANQDPRLLLTDLADSHAAHEGAGSLNDRLDELLSRVACHSAVRAHDPLGPEEIAALLERMDGVDLATHCPHGRPTFLRFSLGDLERLFRRK